MLKQNSTKLTEICVTPGPVLLAVGPSMLRLSKFTNEVSTINTLGIIVTNRKRIGMQSDPITIPKRILSLSGKDIVAK